MTRKFSDLREGMEPDRLEANAEQAAAQLAVMDLAELRGERALTQTEMAERLSIAQSNVYRLDLRGDMLVSTLREVVHAMGGELRISATFPDGSVEIGQFLSAKAQ
jgi:hypothetical protein